MAVRGIDSLRSPLLGPSLGLAPAGPTQALFKNAPGVFVGQPARRLAVCPTGCASCRTPVGGLDPPGGCHMRKKKPVLAYELFLKYGGEGGIDSLRSPLRAARSQARGLSNWRCQLSNPGRGSHPPRWVPHAKKKARTCVRALLKIWR